MVPGTVLFLTLPTVGHMSFFFKKSAGLQCCICQVRDPSDSFDQTADRKPKTTTAT